MTFKNDRKSYREVAKDEDDVEGGSDDWNPSPAIFEGFLKRDFLLCSRNMQMALENAGQPLSFREMKEQLLHSQDVIERVITSKVASSNLFASNGKYSLTRI